jgi:hypothetical protein
VRIVSGQETIAAFIWRRRRRFPAKEQEIFSGNESMNLNEAKRRCRGDASQA